jgi:hypothetical protein
MPIQKFLNNVRLQVLMAANMKMIAFWYIAPCGLGVADRRFGGVYFLHHHVPEIGSGRHL